MRFLLPSPPSFLALGVCPPPASEGPAASPAPSPWPSQALAQGAGRTPRAWFLADKPAQPWTPRPSRLPSPSPQVPLVLLPFLQLFSALPWACAVFTDTWLPGELAFRGLERAVSSQGRAGGAHRFPQINQHACNLEAGSQEARGTEKGTEVRALHRAWRSGICYRRPHSRGEEPWRSVLAQGK